MSVIGVAIGGTFSKKKKKKEGINIVYTEKYLHKVIQFID